MNITYGFINYTYMYMFNSCIYLSCSYVISITKFFIRKNIKLGCIHIFKLTIILMTGKWCFVFSQYILLENKSLILWISPHDYVNVESDKTAVNIYKQKRFMRSHSFCVKIVSYELLAAQYLICSLAHLIQRITYDIVYATETESISQENHRTFHVRLPDNHYWNITKRSLIKWL